jgi:uncharacterized protein (TIGR02147 family)
MRRRAMVNIFDYSDHRRYLADYYEERKKKHPNFSYQAIADKAGIKNKGFIYNIVNGKKSLSKSNIFRISRALSHTRAEAEYFENLVAFNQAEDLTERTYFFEKMNTTKNQGKPASEAHLLRKDQYEFYSTWYHAMVRSIIGMYGFKGDFQRLAKMLDPPITVTQAKHSVRLLEQLGLICKSKNGNYSLSNKGLTTGKDITDIAFQNFHRACIDLAKRALTAFPLAARNFTGLTLGISKNGYARICDEIHEFQDKIMEIAESDEPADRVYQLNFHFFPTSDTDPQRMGK